MIEMEQTTVDEMQPQRATLLPSQSSKCPIDDDVPTLDVITAGSIVYLPRREDISCSQAGNIRANTFT